ncbi:MAG: putative ABC transporter ATP-binding protein [Syntrophorhabdus sp. PtaU1.Bin058]|nr:MAG: putative ABC transporter ATP-binding protein [Syntrophorhabdus sp. PtaU1.Bin058]
MGLAGKEDRYPHELSGGEQQRVAIARALVKGPSIILADEPTGNLDTATGAHVLELLVSQCRQSRTTLIMVSHAMITCQYAQRILRMEDGIVVEDRSCEAQGP